MCKDPLNQGVTISPNPGGSMGFNLACKNMSSSTLILQRMNQFGQPSCSQIFPYCLVYSVNNSFKNTMHPKSIMDCLLKITTTISDLV